MIITLTQECLLELFTPIGPDPGVCVQCQSFEGRKITQNQPF